MWRWQAAPWLVGTLIIGAPHVLGGAVPWSIPIIASVAVVALCAALAAPGLHKEPVPILVWVATGATAWTALQLVPLGVSAIGTISPDKADVLRLLGRVLGAPPWTATAISYDHAATRLELLKGVALACTFTASGIVVTYGARRWVMVSIAMSGALMALVGLVHRALDAQSVYGLYRWKLANPRLPAPILNDNCLAGFLVLTAPVAVALALTARDQRRRVAAYLAAFVIAAAGLMTGSRAGTGAMVFALIAMMVAPRLRSRMHDRPVAGTNAAVLVGAAAIAVAVVVGAEPLFAALSQHDLSKLDLVRDGVRFAWDHPWVGVGRGGFSAGFAAKLTEAGRFVHAENFLVTWCSEWGFPVGILVVTVIARDLVSPLRTSSMARFGAAIGLLAFAAQNLLDLGLELLGIALVAAASLAAVLPSRAADRTNLSTGRANLLTVGHAIAVLGVAALAVLTGPVLAHGESAEQRLSTLRQAGDREAFRTTLNATLVAHPFDPYVYLEAGTEAVDHRDPGALRWLNLAMVRSPGWGAPHAEAARFLALTGRPQQAAIEAREAAARNPVLGARATCTVVRRAPRVDLIMSASQTLLARGEAQPFFTALGRCLAPGLARQLDQHLIAEKILVEGPVLRESQRLRAEGRSNAALELLATAATRPSADARLVLAYAQELIVSGTIDAAEVQLRRAGDLGADPEAIATALANIATARGDVTAMRQAIEELRRLGASSARKLASAAVLRATSEERLGNLNEALAALDDAVTLDPSVPTLRRAIAFAVKHGNPAKALRFRASLCNRAPELSECRAR